MQNVIHTIKSINKNNNPSPNKLNKCTNNKKLKKVKKKIKNNKSIDQISLKSESTCILENAEKIVSDIDHLL